MGVNDQVRYLWGKGRVADHSFHPLIYHLIDVGAVALKFWDIALTESTRTYLSESLGMSPPETRKALSYWSSLHDIGKATPAFQIRLPFMAPVIRKEGLQFLNVNSEESFHHGAATARVCPLLLTQTTSTIPLSLAFEIAFAIGAHHGDWPTQKQTVDLPIYQIGGDEWWAVREAIGHILKDVFSPPNRYPNDWLEDRKNSALALIAGFVSVTDVIGSQEEWFPFEDQWGGFHLYAQQSISKASAAIADLGWDKWSPEEFPVDFKALFGFPDLRPVQKATEQAAAHIVQPSVTIIEAPTGAGKTEAGIFLANYWANKEEQQGWFIAMPTMSTANAMYERVRGLLAERSPDTPHTLSHSRAKVYLDPDLGTQDWFQKRAKNLLAPIGVGTIDQVLMGAMQGSGFFQRMWGIFRKTLICDEVHAYDIYMDSLFYRLLQWLRAMESSVVILTATLPPSIKRNILMSYTGRDVTLSQEEMTNYPAITYANNDTMSSVPLPNNASRTVRIQWEDSKECIHDICGEIVSEGGCAAVICNTVASAQRTYRDIVAHYKHVIPEIILLHAKLPSGQRQQAEKKVLERFGKDSRSRPQRAIVVSTQVMEQSLDVSFDVMLTELSPIDTLIQRMGRLHRHRLSVPQAFSHATLHIVRPISYEHGGYSFGADGYVYAPHLLLKTYLVIKDLEEITLPGDTPLLMQMIYEDSPVAPDHLSVSSSVQALWASSYMTLQNSRRRRKAEAAKSLITMPSDPEFPYRSPEGPQRRFSTRYASRSQRSICLYCVSGQLYLDQEGTEKFDIEAPPSPKETLRLLENEVSIRHPAVIEGLNRVATPQTWRRNSTLRFFKPLIFNGGVCVIAGTDYSVRSSDVGIEIVKDGGEPL